MSETQLPEPWLRGTLQEVPAVQRAVVHALELAREDLQRWCGGLSDEQINARPGGLAAGGVSFAPYCQEPGPAADLRRGTSSRAMSQLAALKTEMGPGATRDALFAELDSALTKSMSRVRAFDANALEQTAKRGQETLAHYGRRVAGACRRSHPASCGAGHYDCENCFHGCLSEPAAFAAGSARHCSVA